MTWGEMTTTQAETDVLLQVGVVGDGAVEKFLVDVEVSFK
jgi:flavin-binding protein dodecin